MTDEKKYIYNNASSPDELQRYLDDVAEIGAIIYGNNGFDVEVYDGKPKVFYFRNGKPDHAACAVTEFDKVKPKHGAKGNYSLNPKYYYRNEPWVDSIPGYDSYTGIYDIDDVSQWELQEDV